MFGKGGSFFALLSTAVLLAVASSTENCPGYRAVNVKRTSSSLKADLVLGGKPCNIYGNDISRLSLEVEYEETTRLHLKITDPSDKRYEVPDSVLPRPKSKRVNAKDSEIQFHYIASPFSFSIVRKSNGDVLFDTKNNPLIFEPQYWNVKTNLPSNPHIYGLGEHTDPFQLPSSNYTRTMWSRDSYAVPSGTNLYGNHPIYFEHRMSGTHGVFLVNSNGMDIKINSDGGTTLEYNVIGGIIDLYFLAGSTSDPTEVARQYARIVGTPAEVPYWSLGFHQCRFGYQSFIEVSQVITNYSAAGIPLETMWTDIDYMDERKIFTTDPVYFPLPKMREIVSYLHAHDQHYILMVDPAVGYSPNTGYRTFDRGLKDGVFMKNPNGSYHIGVVWPGAAVFPDWFHPKVGSYWDNEFKLFFDPKTGIDIDGVWIDMNEPSSFCVFPCTDPYAQAIKQHYPPTRTSAPPNPSALVFQSSAPRSTSEAAKRTTLQGRDLSDQEVMNPPYSIANAAGQLSNRTAYVDAVHYNGLRMYDTHNMYGTMMSVATRNAMLARRPGKKTLVITRSTFAGAGAHVGKWLGDNVSNWVHYRFSIAGMLGMATVYQVPMVGSDVCGFADNTNEVLCARWALLGAFSPFYRNHNIDTAISQEFYRWPLTAAAAKNAIDIRYRLLDYLYTAFHQANADGTPVVNPLFFKFPSDENTFAIDHQFFYGNSILVSPVTEENSTSVTFYLPKARFYDFKTFTPVKGEGKNVTIDNVAYTDIPLYILGGCIIPMRVNSTMTTKQLREQPFTFIIAPGIDDQEASGSLYIDDGISLAPAEGATTRVTMSFSKNRLQVQGKFGYQPAPKVASLTFLSVQNAPAGVRVNGLRVDSKQIEYNTTNQFMLVQTPGLLLDHKFDVELIY